MIDMSLTIPKIAGIGLVALLAAVPYAEARTIRADQGTPTNPNDGWVLCPCAPGALPSLPTGLMFNPTGSVPSVPTNPNAGGPSVFVPDPSFLPDQSVSDLQAGSSPFAPALSYTSPFGALTVQAVYFDLSNLNSPVVLPSTTGVSVGPTTGPSAWEVEFNYGNGNATTSNVPTTASLEFGGTTFTYTGGTGGAAGEAGGGLGLATPGLIEFVFDNNKLYAPSGDWTATSTVTSAPEMDASSAMSGLTLLVGALLVIRANGRKPRGVTV
jgi:hypothetical protein